MNPYTISEWTADFDYQVGLTQLPETRQTGIEQPMRDYFYAQYPESDPVGRIARFFQAMKFLDQNMNQILDGRGGVAGSSESLVGEPVVKALYDHFAHLESSRIYDVPTHEDFLESVRQHGG